MSNREDQKSNAWPVIKKVAWRLSILLLLSISMGLAFSESNHFGVKLSDETKNGIGNTSIPALAFEPAQNFIYSNFIVSVFVDADSGTVGPAHSEGREPISIDWKTAAKLIRDQNAVLVDARPKAAFAAGHIPGAVSLPSVDSDEAFLRFHQHYSTNAIIVAYCSNPECPLSLRLAHNLTERYGYQFVYYVPNGYDEWRKARPANR